MSHPRSRGTKMSKDQILHSIILREERKKERGFILVQGIGLRRPLFDKEWVDPKVIRYKETLYHLFSHDISSENKQQVSTLHS
jgi:hypothetical protein